MKKKAILKKVTASLLVSAIIGTASSASLTIPGISVITNAAAGDIYSTEGLSFQENEDGTCSVCSVLNVNVPDGSIVIPDVYDGHLVTGIKQGIFAEFSASSGNVYNLQLGKNIRNIEPYAFDGIEIGTISVSEESPYYIVSDNILYTADRKTLVYCPNTAAGKITVPAGVTVIRDDAFSSEKIQELYLGPDVAAIPEDAFIRCSGITAFDVNGKNQYYTASGGVLLNRRSTIICAYPKAKNDDYTIPSTIRKIDPYAFAYSKIRELDFSNITFIEKYAFQGCTQMKSVSLPSGLSRIGEGAFEGCTELSTVTMQHGMRSMSARMFKDCTSLSTINVPDSMVLVGADALINTRWYNDKSDGFIYIAKVLYRYKSNYVSSDGKGNPDKAVVLSIKSGTLAVADGALRGANVIKIDIPSSLKYIDAEKIYPAYNVIKFSVDAANPYYTVKNNILFTKNMKKLVCVPSLYSSDSYTVPSSVTEIGSYAFKFNTDIKNISISNTVVQYGLNPFYNGDSQRTVICMEGSAAADAAKADNVSRLYMESSVMLDCTSVTLGAGETKTLTAVVTPDIAPKAVKWNTSNASVVTVSNGSLRALRAGTATITVTESSGKTASCVVIVKNAPKTVKMSKTEMTIGIGETAYLDSILDEGSASASRKYTTSDTSVLSVSDKTWNCCFTGRKAGTAVITVRTFNGRTAQCKITVKAAPQSVTLSKSQITIGIGETVTISSAVNSGSASFSRSYVSGNTNIVQIVPTSWNCTFTGISAGTTYITVRTFNGKAARCKVTVKAPPRFVEMAKEEVSIGVGESMQLGSVLLDGEASASRKYRSSNSSVVKMTKTDWQAGFIGVKQGTAYVTVKTYNDQEASCRVNVKAAPTSVKLSKTSLTLKVGQKSSLSSTVPAGTAATYRVYSSGNSSIVKMTRTNWVGEFTAVKAGVTYVTVRTYNGKAASCKITVVN